MLYNYIINIMIKFGYHELPTIPFIWNYDKYVYPVMNYKYISELDSNYNKFYESDLIKYDTIIEVLKQYNMYKKHIYIVDQLIIDEVEEDKLILNISYHTWFFNLISNKKDMTKFKLYETVYQRCIY